MRLLYDGSGSANSAVLDKVRPVSVWLICQKAMSDESMTMSRTEPKSACSSKIKDAIRFSTRRRTLRAVVMIGPNRIERSMASRMVAALSTANPR